MSRFTSLGLLALLAAGCVTTESSVRPKDPPPPPGAVYQVHAAWDGRLMVRPDAANNGAPLIGLGGRIYLFGEEVGHPVPGDGAVVIELCNLEKLDPKGKPQLLERWEIDKKTLTLLLKKDMIGWGYTLFLPWNTYSPETTKVQMQVRYTPDKGLPIFSPTAVVALHSDNQLTISRRQIPAMAAVSPENAPVPPPANINVSLPPPPMRP